MNNTYRPIYSWSVSVFLLVVLVGCRLPTPVASPTAAATVNIAQEANLHTTHKVEILALDAAKQGDYTLVTTLDDQATIEAIVTALDQALPLLPAVRCIDQYRLRFTLADGVVHEFGYQCQGGESFLQGGPGFLQGHAVQPPTLDEALGPFLNAE
jgi:hypothetical protein